MYFEKTIFLDERRHTGNGQEVGGVTMIVHDIKIRKEYADRIAEGTKKFEVRQNDRDYQVGDILRFHVIDQKTQLIKDKEISHTLENSKYEIIYVHSGLGMQRDYVILGIKCCEFEKEDFKKC